LPLVLRTHSSPSVCVCESLQVYYISIDLASFVTSLCLTFFTKLTGTKDLMSAVYVFPLCYPTPIPDYHNLPLTTYDDTTYDELFQIYIPGYLAVCHAFKHTPFIT
jgi:hypothetical protein